MRYFDMHCDTLMRCVDENATIDDNNFQISLKRLNDFDKSVQFFAAYINTFDYTGKSAYDRFCAEFEVFKTAKNFAEKYKNVVPVLTIENLSCLDGKLENVEYFKQCGVKVASLCWNGYNGIAGGIGSDNGISDFGREVVKEVEKSGIVIDVSHLNDRSFFELCDIAEKPFIATHSDTREYCAQQRNLTNDQLKEIFSRGGIVGLNVYTDFLGERLPQYDDFSRHIENMYKAGGENKVSLGTDFDGCDTDERFNNVSDMPKFYDYLEKSYSKNTADGIFYDNAAKFFDGIIDNV